ncbi:hypothetical protein [Paraburkholderia hospita]|uniref:hypothetical protein n=1 Tax=Paraburkholderia hospita TaxID=169430 RepID=UPI0008A7DC47|nr:hypothetical protein [Paraburkholderia hospita]SEH89905.1 hypothetical protein SAMN05192544_1011156 [Paraburkholderia hospita]
MNIARQLSNLGIPDLHEDAFQPRGGRMRVYGKGGGSAPAPDPAVGQAALQNVQLGKDWLAFANDQFKQGNIRQADLDSLTKQVTESQLAAQNTSNQWAQEDRSRYKQVFQPLQDSYIQQAKEYGTQEKQDQMAATAVADTQQAARQAREANTRSMASMGINPNSGRFEGISRGQEVLDSLNNAGAANNARTAAKDKSLALTADAINMGNGMASQAAGALGLGLNAGNSATGNAGAANANFRANQGVMQSGFQGAIGANNSAGSMLNQQYGTQVQAYSAQQQAQGASSGGMMSGIGAIAGAGIMVF